ncbi:hypothetical protein RHS01_10377 [Rhizoctonia solani]|uniref:RNA-directed DNA polymerase n=1 Tax=Rhizoctonia solani TaxID=456999 RepID=A0A8H7M2H3_9AGAM|nr:hypothetical protein RHS01_10377 [Rhizoctonia solani]
MHLTFRLHPGRVHRGDEGDLCLHFSGVSQRHAPPTRHNVHERGTDASRHSTHPLLLQRPEASEQHTPLPGFHTDSPIRSTEPSPLSILSSLQSDSPVLVDDDLPSDLEKTLRPDASPSPRAESPLLLKLEPASPDVKPAPLSPILPTGTAPLPLGYAVASAMAVQPSEAAAKASAIKSLNALGQFEDNGRPMKEAEYRHKFKYLTADCTDEVRAELWYMNLAYEGPAFYWYHELTETAEGKEAAKKWSTLELEVEKRWNTPAIDLKAFKKRTRNEWEARTFDIEPMLEGLRNPARGTKPHLEWSTYHKALGLRVKTGNAERVANTLRILPTYVINLLPETDQYDEDFDQLMSDLGDLSSSRLLHAFETWAAVEAMRKLAVENPHIPRGHPSPAPTTRQRQPHPTPAPVPDRHIHFQAPLTQSTRGTSLPAQQLVNPAMASLPIRHQSTPPQRAFTRDQPPHVKLEPLGSPPRARSATREPSERPAANRPTTVRSQNGTIGDTPEARQSHQLQLAEWLRRHPSGSAPLNDPPPLTPGTYEQTTDLCIKCAALQIKGPIPAQESNNASAGCGSIPPGCGSRRGRARSRSTGIRAGKRVGSVREDGVRVDPNLAVTSLEGQGYGREYKEDINRTVDHFFSIYEYDSSQLNIFSQYSRCGEIDLSGLESKEARQWPMKMEVAITHMGEKIGRSVWGTVDGGAMLCVLDAVLWAQFEHFVGVLRPSQVVCRMANGVRVASMGTAVSEIEYQGHYWPIAFEILDSGGAFELLIGKDWLSANGARQDFLTDTLSLLSAGQTIYIGNANPESAQASITPKIERALPAEETKPEAAPEPVEKSPTSEPEQTTKSGEQVSEDEREVRRSSRRLAEKRLRRERQERNPFWVSEQGVKAIEETGEMETEETQREAEEARQREIMHMEREPEAETTNHLKRVLQRAKRARDRKAGPAELMTLESERIQQHAAIPQPLLPESERASDPFNPARIAEIQGKVKLGEDLSEEQKRRVKSILGEFADVFALNLSEVLPVSITELRLEVPPETVFPKKIGQKKLTEPQRKALYEMLDELERARIVQRVTQDQVAAVSPISLVPKPASTSAPSIKLLQQMANSECRKYGIPLKYPEVGFYDGPKGTDHPTQPAKWRLVQNFATVNRYTQVKPFPMGDLFAKQQAVAGHKYISVMDLHAGFHAIPIAPESVPYTGFHVDGRGYYTYLRMPFGLTSAPTTFCEMVAKAFHGLIGEDLEVWMDDMAMGANDFESGIAKLTRVLDRCRTHRISLSPGKTVLFMSEARFAGAMVSIEGIKPDLSKVKSILEWPEPQSVLEVMSFIGLANAYRAKIRNFARIAEPLTNLTRNVQKADAGTGGSRHRKALKDAKITLSTTEKRAFAELKIALTSNPVLKPPIYDGRPFIIATDGSKAGFGAVVSQTWEEEDKKGKIHKVTYPIAFASKRTSRSEENYPPFLLEFAALKFGCDEFDNIIFGQPIEIETDCKALADLLGNNKLNSTHERWRESIIARNIVAVRHKPGVENIVCDRLSRMHEGRRNENEGREGSVDPGWESAHDLVNDLYLLTTDTDSNALWDRYAEDDYFREIVLHLLFEAGVEPENEEEVRDWKKRAHKAEGYMIDDGKLMLVGGKHSRGNKPVECIPDTEGLELAHAVHSAGGHFGRDLTILALQQEYHWPRMRRDATEAVTSCPKCRNFGPRLLSALLQPITRARPLDLLVGDYVSLSEGHGGLKNVLVIIDVYSRFMFAFPTRKPGTGKFTVEALNKIADFLGTPCSFMADGGSHFDCEEVKQWARERNVKVIKTPAYAPWVNGLAEGGVKLLSGRLRTLCAPYIGLSRDGESDPEATPRLWPKYLAQAVAQLNDRVLPSLGYTPRELLTGMLSAERSASIGKAIRSPNLSMSVVDVNLALTYSLRDDAFANALTYANRRKRQFDKKARVVDYEVGDLVQRYDARFDETHNALRKLAPRWSGALRIDKKARNSYSLVDMDGKPFAQAAHARLLRPFVPRAGTALAAYADKLREARSANSPAPVTQGLPKTPRPEDRIPLEREDPTQPNNYQDEDSEGEDFS